MLRIVIQSDELFDDEKLEFIPAVDGLVVDLEHSLISLSKWESKYEKPFLSSMDKSSDEVLAYVNAMVVTPDVDPDALLRCSQKNIDEIQNYIDSRQSATTFGAMPERRGQGEVITSELIYYWMVAFNIPFTCETWHLNRLLSLVRICNIKNSPPKKLSRSEIAQRNYELNEKRKQELGTRG